MDAVRTGRDVAISAKVFIGNLNFRTTKEELTELLAEAGQVVSVSIPTERDSGRPRGFAFAEFSTSEEAAEALRLFDGRELGGRRLRINAAEDRPRRQDDRPRRPDDRPRSDDRPRRADGPRPPRAPRPLPPFEPDPALLPPDADEGRGARNKFSRRHPKDRRRFEDYD